MADRTRQPTTTTNAHQIQDAEQAMNTAPPPPYTDADSDAGDYEQEPHHKLIINAEHKITGTGNLVPLDPSVLADATKFSAILLNAITRLNSAANADGDGQTRQLCVDLTINCGVTVLGSRNVVGNIGLKRKTPVPMPNGSKAAEVVCGGEGAVGGAKRKAEDDDDEDTDGEQPAAKRIAADRSVGGD
ncbi:hypothetical protein MBLNU13_g09632t1 [Cladosporium sp. NU13]